jgi:16S rRNA (guanine527-N7)-methyltransferase
MSGREDFQKRFDLDADRFAKICLYHDLLQKWNKAINIVSPASLTHAWERHMADSAQVAQYIPQDVKIYADLGCGGGFPGLVVAMMRPALEVHLVESDERKGQFMRTVIREAGIKTAHVHTKRIEDVTDDFLPDCVSARALKSLPELLDFVWPWAKKNPALSCVFMKGEKAEQEIEAARKAYSFDVQTHISVTNVQAHILVMRGLRYV